MCVFPFWCINFTFPLKIYSIFSFDFSGYIHGAIAKVLASIFLAKSLIVL